LIPMILDHLSIYRAEGNVPEGFDTRPEPEFSAKEYRELRKADPDWYAGVPVELKDPEWEELKSLQDEGLGITTDFHMGDTLFTPPRNLQFINEVKMDAALFENKERGHAPSFLDRILGRGMRGDEPAVPSTFVGGDHKQPESVLCDAHPDLLVHERCHFTPGGKPKTKEWQCGRCRVTIKKVVIDGKVAPTVTLDLNPENGKHNRVQPEQVQVDNGECWHSSQVRLSAVCMCMCVWDLFICHVCT
jgi:hypothetical protein